MDPELYALIRDAAADGLHRTQWVLIVAIPVAAGIGAAFGAYLKKFGELKAVSDRFDQYIEDLKIEIHATEEIRSRFAEHIKILENSLTKQTEQDKLRVALTTRYLFQLQDSVETLWYRLNNVLYDHGKPVMSDTYFDTTTLFAVGRVLASERILALEGVYPQIDAVYPELGGFLRQRRIDLKLQGLGFYQYDRIALAEAVTERDEGGFRTSTYLEFRRRYEMKDSPEKLWLEPARTAIRTLSENKSTMKDLLESLEGVGLKIADITGITTSLVDYNKGMRPTRQAAPRNSSIGR